MRDINKSYMQQKFLMHYGVAGMKWGVRKAQLYGETHDTIGDNYTDKQKNELRSRRKRYWAIV